MLTLSKTETIEILTMISYGDRQRSYQNACDLFNNLHPERNPILQSAVLVKKFKETRRIKSPNV